MADEKNIFLTWTWLALGLIITLVAYPTAPHASGRHHRTTVAYRSSAYSAMMSRPCPHEAAKASYDMRGHASAQLAIPSIAVRWPQSTPRTWLTIARRRRASRTVRP